MRYEAELVFWNIFHLRQGNRTFVLPQYLSLDSGHSRGKGMQWSILFDGGHFLEESPTVNRLQATLLNPKEKESRYIIFSPYFRISPVYQQKLYLPQVSNISKEHPEQLYVM